MIDMDFRTDRYGTEDFWLEEQMTPLGLSRRVGGKGKKTVEAIAFDTDFNDIRYGKTNIALFQGDEFLNGVVRVKMSANNTDYMRFCELMANLKKIGYPEIDCSPKAYGSYVTKGCELSYNSDLHGNSINAKINLKSCADKESVNKEKKEIEGKAIALSLVSGGLACGLAGGILGYYNVPEAHRVFGAGFGGFFGGIFGTMVGAVAGEIIFNGILEPRLLKRAENLGDYIGKCKKGCERLQDIEQDVERAAEYQKVLGRLNFDYGRARRAVRNVGNLQGLVIAVDRKDGDRDKIFGTLADVIGIEELKREEIAGAEGESYTVDGKEIRREGKVIRIKSA